MCVAPISAASRLIAAPRSLGGAERGRVAYWSVTKLTLGSDDTQVGAGAELRVGCEQAFKAGGSCPDDAYRRPGHASLPRHFRSCRVEQGVAAHRRSLRMFNSARMVGATSARLPAAVRLTPRAVTISGTGLSECAVLGLPSGVSICSALPWSAVITQAPPARCTAETT